MDEGSKYNPAILKLFTMLSPTLFYAVLSGPLIELPRFKISLLDSQITRCITLDGAIGVFGIRFFPGSG